MPFIKIYYLYRDFGNYKQYGSVTFSNPNNLSIEKIETELRKHLLDGIWFLHSKWNFPDLHFEKTDFEQDHPYHEFESVEKVERTEKLPVSTIDDFLKKINTNSPPH